MSAGTFNRAAADLLHQCGLLLERQGANPFRVNAYLRAAQTLDGLETDVREIVRTRGIEGLRSLPFIGIGLAQAINEIVKTGRLARLDRLRGAAQPEVLLQTVPGIGPALARKLRDTLDIDSLEELELAAHDGRLTALAGFGPRRAAAIRASVAALLGRTGAPRPQVDGFTPPIGAVLDIDREYREAAAAGGLRRIAPRRFNPGREAWLPVLHSERNGVHFSALYSNTARAHRLGRTGDWVIVYFYDDEHREGQCTVVTETHGPLRGLRVVRGRERDCAAHYRVPAYGAAQGTAAYR